MAKIDVLAEVHDFARTASLYKRSINDVDQFLVFQRNPKSLPSTYEFRMLFAVTSPEIHEKVWRGQFKYGWEMALLRTEVSRLKALPLRILWTLTDENSVAETGEQVEELLTEFAFPFFDRVRTSEAIVTCLVENPNLTELAPTKAKEYIARLEGHL
jgi:hypothetical protein